MVSGTYDLVSNANDLIFEPQKWFLAEKIGFLREVAGGGAFVSHTSSPDAPYRLNFSKPTFIVKVPVHNRRFFPCRIKIPTNDY